MVPFVAGAMMFVLGVYHTQIVRCMGLGTRALRRSGKGDRLMRMTSSLKGLEW
jgi:hypothetical protein